MCRSTDYYGFRCADENLLKMKAFFIRLSGLDSCTDPLSNSLTLLYPPRINDASLEVSGSSIRSDSPAFMILHRMVNVKTKNGEVIYGSRDSVRAGDGVRFEIYSGDEKVLKGIFRSEKKKWKMECKCALERRDGKTGIGIGIGSEGAVPPVADVCVAVEGDVAIGERVEMVARKNKRVGFEQLEDIPEESESNGGGCCCSCDRSDGGGGVDEKCTEEEGVSWAFDVGIWVMCLGVGYLFSRASAKSLRRMRML